MNCSSKKSETLGEKFSKKKKNVVKIGQNDIKKTFQKILIHERKNYPGIRLLDFVEYSSYISEH